jgi:hypothetical protein
VGAKPVLISTKITANEKSGNQHRLPSVHNGGLEAFADEISVDSKKLPD